MPTKKQARRKAESRAAHKAKQAAANQVASKPGAKPLEELPEVRVPKAKVASPRAKTDRLGDLKRFTQRVVAHRAFPVVALVTIFCLSAAIYSIVALRHLVPNLFPDEMRYGKMSQNLADGSGLQWRGSSGGLPPLWTAVLSIVWHFGSVPDGYALGRVLSSVLISATVFPVWLLARELVGPRLALIPAALSVIGAWMTVSSFLVSENLAYPIGTAALACVVMSVRDLRMRWIWGAIGFTLLATATRTQMLSLLVILALALIFDVLRQPSGERRARVAQRPRYMWVGLLAGVVVLLGAFILKPDLTNYQVLAHHVSIGQLASTTGKHAVSALLMFAIVPAAAAFAMMARADNWRDDSSGPILVTIVAASLVLFPLLGRFEAWATEGSPVDRYGMYLAPLFMVALVLAPGRVGRKTALAAAFVVAAAMLALPVANNLIEQPAVYGMEQRIEAVGLLTNHLPTGVALIALALGAIAMVALTSRRQVGLGLALAVTITVTVAVAQNWTAQAREISLERQVVPQVLTKPYDWVDRAVHGPVAMFAIGKGEPLRGNIDLYTDFFNRKVKDFFSTNPQGSYECQLDFKPRGYLLKNGGICPAWPRYYVLLERSVRVTFYGERDIAAQEAGRLVEIPTKEPRVLGLVNPPCTPIDGCSGALQLGLYLDHPARVALTFTPSSTQHRIQAGNQVRVMAAGEPAVVRFTAPAGDHGFKLPVDWVSPVDAPQLQSVYLRYEGKTIRLF